MLRLYKHLKPFSMFVSFVMILVFLQTLADLYLPTLMSDIVNNGILPGDTGYILRTGGRMMLFVLGNVLCAVTASYFSSRVAVGLGRNLRDRMFEKVASWSLDEFDRLGTATLVTRTTNDIMQIQNVTIMILRMMVSAPMMAIGGIILALSKDRPLTLVLAVAIPVLVSTIAALARWALPLFKSMQVKIDRINLVMRENLTGIRVIRAFDRVEYEQKRFERANADLTDTYIRVNRIMAFMFPSIMLIMNVTTIAVVWFGGVRIDSGGMDMGSLVAFIQYSIQIMFSFIMVSVMFIMVPRAQAAAERINEVLALEPGIRDPQTVRSAGDLKGLVEFRDVTFYYHGAERPALDGVTFTAHPGQTIAIIGGTGSGKSTLANLIPRFYDVNGGSVRVDGVDVREMTQRELRAKIGYVPQNTMVFSGTVADNIRFGREEAGDDEVEEAARAAQAMEFIKEMDGGFGHVIAQGGANVSGGQKQRLSIARALVRRPEIYIFDDSFSALDFKTDARLRAALKKYAAQSTVFIISQRVSTVMNADAILVLDEGRVAGIGKHRELLESCEIYREIAASQLSEEELA